jgi:hypothetical protein
MSRRRVRQSTVDQPWNEEVSALNAANAAPNAQSKWMNSMNYNYVVIPQALQAPATMSYPVRIQAILEKIKRVPVALNPQNTSGIYKEKELYEEIVEITKEKIKSLKDDLKYSLEENINYGGAKTRRKRRK